MYMYAYVWGEREYVTVHGTGHPIAAISDIFARHCGFIVKIDLNDNVCYVISLYVSLKIEKPFKSN